MPRTVLIIPADADALDYLDQAAEAGASEILTGVPPALLEQVQQLDDVDVVEHVETDEDDEVVSSVPSVAEPAVVVIPDPPSESPDPAPREGLAAVDLQTQVDGLLALLLTAQAGGPVPDVDWPTILAGMVARGRAGEHELRGAHGWGLITEDVLADLLAAAEASAPGA